MRPFGAGFRSAFGYFTAIRVGTRDAPDEVAVAFLPFVGLLLGAICGGIGFAGSFVVPHAIAVSIVFVAGVLLTGAVHADGFMDTCDACFAAVPPARRLEILRDPRHGTFAVAGMLCASALWLAGLWYVPFAALPLALALVFAAARLASVANALVVPYARETPSSALGARPPWWLLGLFAIATEWLAFALHVRGAVWIVPALIALALACGQYLKRLLGGGLTGDAYGFMIFSGEAIGLAALGTLYTRM
ncbi:MAG: adenosylcobinamide-GDP ribazoletransferase [Candidatus Eremiobacteraeota bacterium]|nr:adenosylcobinamide-GDP ribazoletransferase [Candidatus Eremiobacteraeota bacterium]